MTSYVQRFLQPSPTLYPWQHEQWRQLLSMYRQDRLPHALLFTGSEGLGKQAFAQAWARFLLCQSKTSLEYACGQCSGCRLICAGNHPDLITLSPEEDSKIIKIDSIRKMIDQLSQTSHRAGYQVVILYPAESLNKAAANALLKTLEEPSGAVILLLVSHRPGALPATLLSRCQRISFSSSAHSETVQWLTRELQTLNIAADADILLKAAESAPLQAFALGKNQYLDLRDRLLRDLSAIAQKKVNPIDPVPAYLKQDLSYFLNAFFSLVMDMIRLQLNVQFERLMNVDRLTALRALAQCYSSRTLSLILTELTQARHWLTSANVHLNTQLLLENLFLQMEEKKDAFC